MRDSQSQNGQTLHYIYDQTSLIAETNTNNDEIARSSYYSAGHYSVGMNGQLVIESSLSHSPEHSSEHFAGEIQHSNPYPLVDGPGPGSLYGLHTNPACEPLEVPAVVREQCRNVVSQHGGDDIGVVDLLAAAGDSRPSNQAALR